MKSGFYSKIAFGNLKKNARFYIPRILTEVGLLGCFYILLTLTLDERLRNIRGGSYLPGFMMIGVGVTTILAVILLFYINSFLMKQRKHEFGLYNILGMEKRHVSLVLFFESFFSGTVSVVTGLLGGMLMYKLCSLCVMRLLREEIMFGFDFIQAMPLLISALVFVAIDVVVFFLNCISIARMKPVELLSSSHTGEKEPKVKWVLLILGLLTMGAGYIMALTTKNPVMAANLFFVAVILVVIGTYCLFVAGTIWVLKILKANRRYYYNRKHMPAVSGLLYRMKQNAVGLSSITILATIVLVMISTTVSLYAGMNRSLAQNYPEHLYFGVKYSDSQGNTKYVSKEKLEEIVRASADKYGVEIEGIIPQRYLDVTFRFEGNVASTNHKIQASSDDVISSLSICEFITTEDYETMTGEKLDLEEGQIAVYYYDKESPFKGNSMVIGDREYVVEETLTRFPIRHSMRDIVSKMGIVLPGEEDFSYVNQFQNEAYYTNASSVFDGIAVSFADMGDMLAHGKDMENDTEARMKEYFATIDKTEGCTYMYDSYWKEYEMDLEMYGSLLFLGTLLGIVFMFATALIIYYKQISEGYEDAYRFQIMEKVGMSKKEVRSTIKSQILLVFFLPIVVAGIHMCVASPILLKLLHIFALASDSLYIICAVIVYAVFVLLYTCIYLGTARTYYKIVR